ncbi:hypothetical protein [Streptomyces sp. CA-106131]|uniref:hypothetical protein n=1 Tax=Streptomyces sp. CA-106131 TaxID=3240045 RepID=UPI003D927E97
MSLVVDQDGVEDLAAQGAHGSLADCVRSRCPRRAEQDLHVVGLEDGVEGMGVLRIPITEQEAQRVHPAPQGHGQIPGLLDGPPCGGAGGYTGEVDTPRAVLDKDQGIQAPERNGVEVQEVRGEDAVSLGIRELAPGWAGALRGRVDAGGVQNLPDRGRGDRVPKARELALYPAVAQV